MKPNAISLALVAAFALSAACGPEKVPLPPQSISFTDVRNTHPAWKAGEEWRVDSLPLLTIGTVDGPAETVFGGLALPAITPSGRIVLADDRYKLVRVFDSSGKFITSFGRRGDGPGEFAQAHLYVYSVNEDTIAVLESRWPEGRVLYFSIANGFLHAAKMSTHALRSPSAYFDWHANSAPGGTSVLMRGESVDLRAKYEPRMMRHDVLVVWTDSAMRVIKNIGFRQGREYFQLPMTANYGSRISASPYTDISPPFAGNIQYGADPRGQRVCLGNTRHPRVECYSRDGSSFRVHWKADTVPISAAEEQRWRTYIDSTFRVEEKEMSAAVRASVATLRFEMTKPFFRTIHVDADRNLWVEMPLKRARGTGTPRIYSIFNSDGLYLGDIALPTDLNIEVIARDRIIARGRGEDDVPVARIYRIVKPLQGHPEARSNRDR